MGSAQSMSIGARLGHRFAGFVLKNDGINHFVSERLISKYADPGPLPVVYNTGEDGTTSQHEMEDKEFFGLELPPPTRREIESLPPIDEVVDLFRRTEEAPESRVSLLLPFFAQHLTDAVFQSDGQFKTDAPHDIVLNQIYGNTAEDTKILRSGRDGKLKTQTRIVDGKQAEFPDALCERYDGGSDEDWRIKSEYEGLSYLQKPGKADRLLEAYRRREGALCAVGLFQGNMTLGNFAITALMVREHNRLCDGIKDELGPRATDEEIFKIARRVNTVTYMKVVIEDYINTFAGQKIFKLDPESFFYEKKRWCRESPIPWHFNILYRLHSMIPDQLDAIPFLGFNAFLANNRLVMEKGLGPIFAAASAQPSSTVSLGNTHQGLIETTERPTIYKGREMLASFNAHREVQKPGSSVGFDAFDPKFRNDLKRLYSGDPNRIEYYVGVIAEAKQQGFLERTGLKKDAILGPTLLEGIAKHAFRHILSNPLMSREWLNPEQMTEFGWDNFTSTSTVAQLVARNVPELDGRQGANLDISFDAPEFRI